ncbi:MAG1430 family protein [Mycoplasmopsis opalescens]|uniref:MAG1430 family protein n=1 Tax=Mycoplasmopsis opalescens TaxID=114886 RepID=UPI0004A70F69|nr:hypothetical protein [Mycoplasmopsis opalescens]
MKRKAKLALSLGLSVAFVTGISIAAVKIVDSTKKIGRETLINNYEFSTTDKLDKTKYYASEFVSANYGMSRWSAYSQPSLQYTGEGKEFWPDQLEISTKKRGKSESGKELPEGTIKKQRDQYFTLLAKNGSPINVLKIDQGYNVFYRSYANDIDGTLYFVLALEDKKDLEKSKKNSTNFDSIDDERISKWVKKVYKIDGFRKFNQETHALNDNGSPRVGSFDIKPSSSLINKFANTSDANHFASAQAFIDTLPTSEIKIDENKPAEQLKNDKEKLKQENEKITKYISLPYSNTFGNTKFEIDREKPLWITKDDKNSNRFKLNFYVKTYVDAASEVAKNQEEKNPLERIKKIPLNFVNSQDVIIDYFDLKAVSEDIIIKVKHKGENNDKKLSDFNQKSLNYVSSGEKVTISEIELGLKDNSQYDSSKYEFYFYKGEFTGSDGKTIKTIDQYPSNKIQEANSDKISFVILIKHKHRENGTMSYIYAKEFDTFKVPDPANNN